MNSQRGNGSRGDLSNKGKAIANPDSITHDMLGLGIENQQDDGWEIVVSRKNRSRSGPASAPPPPPVHQPAHYTSATPQPIFRGSRSGRGRNGSGSGFVDLNPKSSVLAPNLGPYPNPWPLTPDPHKPGSQANPRLQHQTPKQDVTPLSKSGVHPPLVGGWNWAARARVAVPQRNVEVVLCPPDSELETKNDSGNNNDLANNCDDDMDEDYDSDASQKRHGCTPKTYVEGQSSEGQASRLIDNILLRILVPSHKVGQLIGTGGEVIRVIKTTYNCKLQVLHRSQDEPTAIIIGKDEPEMKIPRVIEAFLRVHRICTSPGQHRTAVTNKIVTCMLARKQHLTDFSGIAEDCHTQIIIKDDVRMFDLPDDRIIEVRGELHGVRRTVFHLCQYLRKFLLDDSIINLFMVEPKMHFRSISPLVGSWYHRLPLEYRIAADVAINYINSSPGVVGVVQDERPGFFIVELIGRRVDLHQAIEFFKKSMDDQIILQKSVDDVS